MVKHLVPKNFWFVSSTLAVACAAVAALQSTAVAADANHEVNEYAKGASLLVAPSKISVSETGKLEFTKSDWKSDLQTDGTMLLSYLKTDKKTKKVPEARAAVLQNKEGVVESMTSYALSPNEDSTTVFYKGSTLAAFSSCEDAPAKEGEKNVGRVCVTATPNLCKAMAAANVTPEVMKEMDTFEMRALAILLTLRGPDHQLDNVAKSGNRLGLKSALQTTKGQLLALARQINKGSDKDRSVASVMTAEQLAEKSAQEQKLMIDEKLSKTILERSIPRLKKACASLGT